MNAVRVSAGPVFGLIGSSKVWDRGTALTSRGNLWRRLVLPPRIKRWWFTSLQQRLVKIGGRLVKHARYYWLLLARGF